MTLKIQNYRSSTSGDKPPSLLEGQLAYNLADNFMYLGKGLNQNLDVNGDPVLPDPPAGEGWQEYNLDTQAPGNVTTVTTSGFGITASPTSGNVVITSTLIQQNAGSSSMSIGPSTPAPGSSSGGNTFVGAFAGEDHGGTNGLSTYVGSNSGKNVVGGNQNVFVGALTAGHPVTSASGCTFIGYNPGASLSASTSLMTIVGGHQGYAGTSGEVIIGRNSCFLRLNTHGALCIADNVATQDFGVTGQVLTSNGDTDPPTWENPGAYSDTGSVGAGLTGSPYIYSFPASGQKLVKLAIMANSGADKFYSWVIDLAMTYNGTTITEYNNIATVLEAGSGTQTLTPGISVSGSQANVNLAASTGTYTAWSYQITALIY